MNFSREMDTSDTRDVIIKEESALDVMLAVGNDFGESKHVFTKVMKI